MTVYKTPTLLFATLGHPQVMRRLRFYTKFNLFLFALESILLWHEAGVIPLLSAGGSKFQNTMTEEGCAPWKWKWKCVFLC